MRASDRTQIIAVVVIVIAIVAAVGIGAYALQFASFGRGTMAGVSGGPNVQMGGDMGSQCCAVPAGDRIAREDVTEIMDEENTIVILDYEVDPQTITISIGTTITWVNMDVVTHTIDSGIHDNPTDLFESGSLEQTESFSYTFNEPGVYLYHCDPHPYMEGEIVVES